MLFGSPSVPELVAGLIAIAVGLTFHEFSHAYVADEMGDRGPRFSGRLTLNPMAHLDPLGALLILIAGFGWAKPVMVNPAALRGGARSMAFVAFAGPLANVAVAVGFAVVFRVLVAFGVQNDFMLQVLGSVVQLNLVLAIFNLLPIPPLDGYNVALAVLPPREAMVVRRYANYGVMVLLGLVLLSYVNSPINPLGWMFTIASSLTQLLLGL